LNPTTGHWTVAMPVAWGQLLDSAQFTCLKQTYSDEQGHRYFHIVGDLEADAFEDDKLTLWHLKQDHFAWLGTAASASRRRGVIQ